MTVEFLRFQFYFIIMLQQCEAAIVYMLHCIRYLRELLRSELTYLLTLQIEVYSYYYY